MREEVVTVKEEKCCLFQCLFRLAVFAATVYGAVTAAKKVMNRLSARLEADNEENEKKRYFFGMVRRTVCPEMPVSDIDMTVVAACAELDLSEAELSEETFVKVRTLGGKVVIKVPAMVRVKLEGKGVVCGFSDMVPAYEDESLPVVYVDAESAVACLKIVIGDE